MSFSSTCRACLSKSVITKNMFNKYTTDNLKNLADCFFICTEIEIHQNDKLQEICINCELLLKLSYSFRQQCEKSNEKLVRNYLENEETTNENYSHEKISIKLNRELKRSKQKLENLNTSKTKRSCFRNRNSLLKNPIQNIINYEPESIKIEIDEPIKIEINKTENDFKLETEEFIFEDDGVNDDNMDEIYKNDSENEINNYNTLEIELPTTSQTIENEVTVPITIQNICSLCDKKFLNQRHLQTHLQIHSPNVHICKICNRKSASKSALKMHMITHEKYNEQLISYDHNDSTEDEYPIEYLIE